MLNAQCSILFWFQACRTHETPLGVSKRKLMDTEVHIPIGTGESRPRTIIHLPWNGQILRRKNALIGDRCDIYIYTQQTFPKHRTPKIQLHTASASVGRTSLRDLSCCYCRVFYVTVTGKMHVCIREKVTDICRKHERKRQNTPKVSALGSK